MLKQFFKNMMRRSGYELRRTPPHDLPAEFLAIHEQAARFGGPSIERNFALYAAVQYVARHDIPGDLVECGVHHGASCAIMALTLKALGATDRRIFLYDTFRGMPEPGEQDVDVHNAPARDQWQAAQRDDHNEWAYGPLPQVRENMRSTGYPFQKFVFVEGLVEQTIPAVVPESIAILRLDTDWYESTWHELVHLYPRLAQRGILLIDDYGAWKGARDATDKYLAQNRIPMYLARIDSTGRIGVKT